MVLVGCTDTDTSLEDDPMQGTWNLLNISGGFVGMDQDFEKGAIVWEFHPGQQRLVVVNNVPSDPMYAGLGTGSYRYSVEVKNSNAYVRINDVELGGVAFFRSKMVVVKILGAKAMERIVSFLF